MDRLEEKLRKHVDLLTERYPKLACIRKEIIDAYLVMQECYENDGKLLIAGNGGSAADSEHIAGELMKRFRTPRPVPAEFAARLKEIDAERGTGLAANLERSLMAIPLVAHEALTTAYINDVADVAEEFEMMLKEQVDKIFNPEVDFVPTTERERCQVCPYKGLCSLSSLKS